MVSDGDRLLLALVILLVSLGVIAIVAIGACLPNPLRAETPPPDDAGATYLCYCYRDDVPVQIQVRAAPRRRWRARGGPPRHARDRPGVDAGSDGKGEKRLR